ncbi:hypothetical protein FN846DRAFT_949688 [Sphaerosporella brunnea]|uniref:Uncharacterized protein n=1 Tax=Sphaerosporella brunnea TaxID=1250544 RepID=A0A5J5EX11_9PEZI|nr:hypothetical protein FN846DRAFT_949688 [Sphaerosporella brunnea]
MYRRIYLLHILTIQAPATSVGDSQQSGGRVGPAGFNTRRRLPAIIHSYHHHHLIMLPIQPYESVAARIQVAIEVLRERWGQNPNLCVAGAL